MIPSIQINIFSGICRGLRDAALRVAPAAHHLLLTACNPTVENIDICLEGLTGRKVIDESARAVNRKVVVKARELYPAVSKSEVGRWVESYVRLGVGEFCGSWVGSEYPEGTLSYSVGSAVARRALIDPQLWKTQVVGSVCFVTATVASPLIFEYGVVMRHLISAAGSIVGGLEGRALMMLKETPMSLQGSYKGKKLQSIVAQGLVSAVRNASPYPCTPIGWSAHFIAGFASYHGRLIYRVVTAKERPSGVIKNLEPAHLITKVATKMYGKGGTARLVEQLTLDERGVSQVPVQIQSFISRKVEEQHVVNAIVRSVNSYAAMLAQPEIRDQLNHLARFPGLREIVKRNIKAHVMSTFTRADRACAASLSWVLTDAKIEQMAEKIALAMKKFERKKVGIPISNVTRNKELIGLHAHCLAPLLAKDIVLGMRTKSEPLTPEELNSFYTHLGHAAMNPYKDVIPFSIEVLTPLLQRPEWVIGSLDKLLDALVEDVSRVPPIPSDFQIRLDRWLSVAAYLGQALKVALIALIAYVGIQKVAPRLRAINFASIAENRVFDGFKYLLTSR